MMEHPFRLPSSRDLYNYEPNDEENTGNITGRSLHSCSSPSKTKRSLIKINHRRLPQDFFNFGTSKIYDQKNVQKLNASPAPNNQAEPQQKDKQQIKGIWLPNFGEQIMMGGQSFMVSDQSDIKKIRNKFAKGLMKTHNECNSPLISFGTIGVMTPSSFTGNQSPMIDLPNFEWTFSKDMYTSISPSKPREQKKELHLRRGDSLKQRDISGSFSARSCEKERSFFIGRRTRKLSNQSNCSRIQTQLPSIHRKRV